MPGPEHQDVALTEPDPLEPLDLSQGSYRGGRKPADGRIDMSAEAIRLGRTLVALMPDECATVPATKA